MLRLNAADLKWCRLDAVIVGQDRFKVRKDERSQGVFKLKQIYLQVPTAKMFLTITKLQFQCEKIQHGSLKCYRRRKYFADEKS